MAAGPNRLGQVPAVRGVLGRGLSGAQPPEHRPQPTPARQVRRHAHGHRADRTRLAVRRGHRARLRCRSCITGFGLTGDGYRNDQGRAWVPDSRGPPPIRRSRLDEREEWIRQNAASLRQTLANPAARAELLALLGGDDPERRRERRLEEARRDLASMELRLKLAEDEVWEP